MASVKLYSGEVAIVDDKDAQVVSGFTWYKAGNYAVANVRIRKGVWKQTSMHRLITNCPSGMHVDHIDGNTLNNTKSNLRICTASENGKNRRISKSNKSGFKGVSYATKSRSWIAHIKNDGKSIHLGCHLTPELAYEAYKSAAHKYHGKFARI